MRSDVIGLFIFNEETGSLLATFNEGDCNKSRTSSTLSSRENLWGTADGFSLLNISVSWTINAFNYYPLLYYLSTHFEWVKIIILKNYNALYTTKSIEYFLFHNFLVPFRLMLLLPPEVKKKNFITRSVLISCCTIPTIIRRSNTRISYQWSITLTLN